MNTDLQIFTNEQFGSVRTIDEGDTVLFCGSDIAKALSYARPNDAISAHCRSTVKRRIATSQGNESEMSFIPEGDVYRLIIRSNLPEAVKFEKWLFEEVLPSIRKHGGYLTPDKIEEALLNPDVLIRLATDLKLEREQRKAVEASNKVLEERVSIMEPKADTYDALMGSTDTIEMATVAKILNVGIGRNRLFDILREQKVLREDNTPMQYYVDLKWFKCVESKYTKPDGGTFINVKTVVYQKGIDGILKLLKEKYNLCPKVAEKITA